MTIKEEIIKILNANVELNLNDIYLLLPSYKKEVIRGIINNEIKFNKTFERTGKGKYKLKTV